MSAVKVKNHNDKIYKNKNGNLQEILRAIEVEGTLWTEAQLSIKKDLPMVQQTFDWQSLGQTRICYVDGAWKEKDKFTGHGWFCRTT